MQAALLIQLMLSLVYPRFILKPVLFNLHFKSAELIDNSYGLGVQLYADDMQCRVVSPAGFFG